MRTKMGIKGSIRALVIALVVMVLPGCTKSWWQNVSSDPQAYVSTLEGDISTFVHTADAIVATFQPYLGSQSQELLARYAQAKAALGHAEWALNDALAAAAAAKQDFPDLTNFVADVLAAADQMIACVNAIKAAAASNTPPVTGMPALAATSPGSAYQDLTNERLSLERLRHQ